MDPLLEPFDLRHLHLRNRIISTAHAPAYQEGGHPRDRYRLYHEEKAKGGVALTIIGGSTNIAPDSPSVFGQLYAGDDSIVPWFQKLTTSVKSHGAAIMCQITHMGRRTAADDGHWLPVIGPSATRERAHRAVPKAMEDFDLSRIVEDFVVTARRCQDGGFDGIEILSHSHLLGQFLSPLVNQRTDAYGGDLANRLRLSHEVLAAVRGAVGPEFIVGMRVTGDELTAGGLSAEDCVTSAQSLAATGQVDFFNVLAGAPYDDLGLAGWVSPMGLPSAPHLTVAGRIRAAVSIPIVHAGGIADLASARHAVADGHVDLVGMTRAHLADPYLVEKLAHGAEDRIRPCVGLGYCVDRVNQGKDALCGHNAATGREAVMPHKIERATKRKKVVVVGGGPGGLEAARVSALRGHEVVLFEASDRLGGQIKLAAKSKTRRQIWGIADWLISEVTKLDVTVQLNTFAGVEDVLAQIPDVVLIATGGWPESLEIPGGDLCHSSWDVLSNNVRPSGAVLIFDEVGDHSALACANVLAGQGCTVDHVTPDRMTAQNLGPTNSAVTLRDLARTGVSFECFQDLTEVKSHGNRLAVSMCHTLTGHMEERLVDAVIVDHPTTPMDELYLELCDMSHNRGNLNQAAMITGRNPFMAGQTRGQFYLARLGDAVAHRNIHAAIYDALRLTKDL